MTRRSRTPSVRETPPDRKQPRVDPSHDPSHLDRETIVWRFSLVDEDGPWGWRTVAARLWWGEILPRLKNFETMTWEEILKASGGRSRGNNSHHVLTEKLTRQAKNRLAEIQNEDVSQLFSLRLTATTRIYGIRDRRALKLLWYDPHHGDNSKAVYPVRGR